MNVVYRDVRLISDSFHETFKTLEKKGEDVRTLIVSILAKKTNASAADISVELTPNGHMDYHGDLRWPREIDRAVAAQAAQAGVSTGDIIIDAIEEGLKAHL